MVAKLEVCVDTIESAINAWKGGASRLELCCSLSEGGLTPSQGLLAVVKSCVSIPVFVMLRPRSGLDFVYSDLEVEIIKKDATCLKEAGADGFVFGALTIDGEVDVKTCQQIVEIVSPLPVTFHRAFDVVSDPIEAMEVIIKLGFERILTSGQEASAEKGVGLIRKLILHSNKRILVMPGAGITKHNIKEILSITRATEFHASARSRKKLLCRNFDLKMGCVDDLSILITDEELVKEILNVAGTL